ncbi:hypothetical protein GH5_04143 [Leishmania sp. Ghana 2012 LV757]|uniref:hypothetical protein n=1 Tax=Leishmania sp. Ghana 2012 LV757 TaxID=2803181 RepID=UPI001B711C49|nr:hypothetical protein GH5_04143 [Leishmania sp. Ghana 2012 LV757]
MDPVQELIAAVGQADMEGGRRRTQASLLSSSAALDVSSACASAAPPRRTKMVFVYSDEDDGEDDGVEGHGAMRPESGVAEVLCDDHAIAVSADALAELQAEAANAAVGTADAQTSLFDASGDGNGFLFEEDVVSGLAGGVSGPSATFGGMRMREVAAPRLWEGAVAPAASSDFRGGGADDPLSATDEAHPFLRRGLPAADFVLRSRRKRFREIPVADGDPAQSSAKNAAATTTAGESVQESPAAAAEPSLHDPHLSSELFPGHPQGAQNSDGSLLDDASDSLEAAVEEEPDVYPVYADDGRTVRALRTRGGYELTLDERDLLECVAEEEEKDARDGHAEQNDGAAAAGAEEGKAADDGDHDAHVDDVLSGPMAGQLASSAAAAAEDGDEVAGTDLPEQAESDELGDFDDFDDEEDEEEAELDEAIIVAVVEQLVCCCKADDLDPQMAVEAARFVGTAKPLLEQLTNEMITPAEFVQRIDRDLRRFQRIYKAVYRPRDSPIVIDGVTTDL